MQMRSPWSRVIALALLGSMFSVHAASASEVRGRVKSVDAGSKRVVITDQKTGNDVTVVLTDQTSVESGKNKKMPISRLKVGALVTVNDAEVATSIDVRGELIGTIKTIEGTTRLVLAQELTNTEFAVPISSKTIIEDVSGGKASMDHLAPGARVIIVRDEDEAASKIVVEADTPNLLMDFWENFRHNLFKPLLLFFYMGFLVPVLRVKFEFPYVIYQALTIFLLIAIGWHGGEELANLRSEELFGAVGFMGVGFLTNFVIGVLAYLILSTMTRMRRVDKATVAGYYGSDSAGTFVTCLGVLATAGYVYDAYMPVMLAVMEIPGCLVALYLVSRLRLQGMDPVGNMPDEPGYNPHAKAPIQASMVSHDSHGGPVDPAVEAEREMSLEKMEHPLKRSHEKPKGFLSPQLLHEVFLNPGLYLLFGGIIIGFISGKQGPQVTRADDSFFVDLFQGVLCLFLLEMGMTASRKLKDLRTAGPGFIFAALLMPNLFATIGIFVAHAYSVMTGAHFAIGTYVLFSVLCGAASYIAVPAVQRLAIPEASPTLPLAASLGLTFTWNVTIGIPIYIEITKLVMRFWPS